MADLTGGCACGAVRYRLKSKPYDTGWCHCRTCQLVSGAPAMVFTSVPTEDFVVEAGADALGNFKSSSFGRRQFCRHCGTPLTIDVDHEIGSIDISAATLDDPNSVTPGFHIFWASRIAWFEGAPTLPKYERVRPHRPPLPGSEPPGGV